MAEIFLLRFSKKVQDNEHFHLLQTMVIASEKAWREAIKPRMERVRLQSIDIKASKKGTDFFTEADTESERIIRETFFARYGEATLRIFGEESAQYLGHLEAEMTIRIDPIDGTEAFKFGKANWSIMIGAYAGRGASERQVVSLIYWPEYYQQVLVSLDGVGVFIGNIVTGTVTEIGPMAQQDELSDIIVAFHKHSHLQERGEDDKIIMDLEKVGARVRFLVPTEVKEAIETHGRRAMILDGDFNEVDFISYSALVRLGYHLYDWDGIECRVDDPGIANKKLLFLPPGKAGRIVLEIVKKYSATSILS